jgi:hypothetical protein
MLRRTRSLKVPTYSKIVATVAALKRGDPLKVDLCNCGQISIWPGTH